MYYIPGTYKEKLCPSANAYKLIELKHGLIGYFAFFGGPYINPRNGQPRPCGRILKGRNFIIQINFGTIFNGSG